MGYMILDEKYGMTWMMNFNNDMLSSDIFSRHEQDFPFFSHWQGENWKQRSLYIAGNVPADIELSDARSR